MLTIEYKLVSFDYFMSEMSLYEMEYLISNLGFADRSLKEFGRLSSYVVAQVNSTKRLKLKDICELPWDEKPKELSQEEHQKMQEKIKNFAASLSNKDKQYIK